MANSRKHKGGRVTPKGGRSAAPPPVVKPVGQVGRHPSNPTFLAVVGAAWIICGIAAFFVFKETWRIVVGVVFIGVGLYWLRGAFATVARHEEQLGDDGP